MNRSFSNLLADPMVIDVDMLGTCVVDVVFSNVDGGGIITSQGSRR